MTDYCEDCSCGLADEDVDLEEAEVPLELQFGEAVREYVLDKVDLDDEDGAFIQRVEVCPEKVVVQYDQR